MQNQWKLLSQLRDYLNKSHDKNQPFNLSKEWLDSLQKLTYSQFDAIRKLSSSEPGNSDASKNLNAQQKDKDTSKADARLMTRETVLDNSVLQQKSQQVIICKQK